MKKFILTRKSKETQIKKNLTVEETINSIKKTKKIATKFGIIYVSTFFLLASNELNQLEAEAQPLKSQIISIPQRETYTLNRVCLTESIYKMAMQDIKTRAIEEKIRTYCKIFQLKEEIVIIKAKEITNNFTDSEWTENNNIKGTTIRKEERAYASPELGILAFVKCLKQNPEDFELEFNNVKSDIPYQMETSYEEFTEEICSLLNYLDTDLCQAIQYHETGFYTEPIFLERNNVGGIRTMAGEYQKFDNPAEGIIELAFLLEYKYLTDLKISESTTIEETIQRIQKKYCPTILGEEENQNWIPRVTEYYYGIQEAKYTPHGYEKRL